MLKHRSSTPTQSGNLLSSGGMRHSRLKSRGFTWQYACERALKKQLYRSIHLARTNTDYQIKYPNECRDNPNGENKCHPEAEKRIIKEHAKILEKAIVPRVERPKRPSRVN